MNRTSQYLTATGEPACGRGCRWPRGRCPTHGTPTVAGTAVGLTVLDRTCKACGFAQHASTCPTLKPWTFTAPTSEHPMAGGHAGTRGGFAVGDLVRFIYDGSDGPEPGKYVRGRVYRVAKLGGLMQPTLQVEGLHDDGWRNQTKFERVSADELPPGWGAEPSEVKAGTVTSYWYEPKGWATHDECPAVSKLCKDPWYVLRGMDGSSLHLGGVPMHEAMRLARGLDRVEQLWDIPASPVAPDGGKDVGRPGADAPRAPAAADAGQRCKGAGDGEPLGQVAPVPRPQKGLLAQLCGGGS